MVFNQSERAKFSVYILNGYIIFPLYVITNLKRLRIKKAIKTAFSRLPSNVALPDYITDTPNPKLKAYETGYFNMQ